MSWTITIVSTIASVAATAFLVNRNRENSIELDKIRKELEALSKGLPKDAIDLCAKTLYRVKQDNVFAERTENRILRAIWWFNHMKWAIRRALGLRQPNRIPITRFNKSKDKDLLHGIVAWWELFQFILPHKIRHEAFEPAYNEIKKDYLLAQLYRGKWAKRWLFVSVSFVKPCT